MPSKSKAQNRAMHAAAEDKAVAKKMDIPQSVAKKFVKEDKGRKLKRLPEHVKKKG